MQTIKNNVTGESITILGSVVDNEKTIFQTEGGDIIFHKTEIGFVSDDFSLEGEVETETIETPVEVPIEIPVV